MNDFQTIFTPSKAHLSQIKTWLKEEQNQGYNNFYSNWDLTIKTHINNGLAVFIKNNLAIGFVAYRISNAIMDIDIAVISSKYRNKGIGKLFINDVLNKGKESGVLVCQLFCSPKSTEPIWRSLGFQNFPKLFCSEEIWMFKPLIPTLSNSDAGNYSEKIELWNSEPHIASKTIPKYTWNLEFKNSSKELLEPIIFPVHYDWQIKWTKGSEVIYKGIMKKFKYNQSEVYDYLILFE